MAGLSGYGQAVISSAEAFALRHAGTERLRKMFRIAFQGLRQMADGEDSLPAFIHLPLYVYAALKRDERPAMPLAAATTLLFTGIDLIDDVADNDLSACWDGYAPAEINLMAMTLVSCLPQLAVSELLVSNHEPHFSGPSFRRCVEPESSAFKAVRHGVEGRAINESGVSPSLIAAMQKAIAEGLLKMAAGQQSDITFRGRNEVSPEEVEASVAGKSGEEVALFATLAALLAGADEETVDTFAAFGRALGTAGQLGSDCNDIFHSKKSKDLANGTRSLPVAMYLQRLSGKERDGFIGLLDKAGSDEDVRYELRKTLIASGVLRKCAFIVEVYCQKARQELEKVESKGSGRSGLLRMIEDISFFGRMPDKT